MEKLNIGGSTFAYRFDGPEKAPVLMLSNSLGTDMTMWDQQVPEWSKQFRVLRYDTRGHGASDATPGPYAMAQLGRDAVALMDALGLKKVHWCGLSMGGMTGMWLLTHAPKRLGRTVLANTAAVMGPPDGWNSRIRLVNAQGMAPIAAALKDRWFTKALQEKGSADMDRIVATFRTISPAGYVACCAAIRDMDQSEAIRAIRNKPVLVIIGKQDPATPPALGEAIAAAIPGASKKLLDAAHLSNVEKPGQFTKAVLEFLQ